MPYGGCTIVEETLDHLIKSKLDRIIIITGFENKLIEEELKNQISPRVSCRFNSSYRLGRSSSIRSAVSLVRDQADALLFMVADKPAVTTELIDRAIDTFKSKLPGILHVLTPGGRGHPIIFGRKLYDELEELKGDITGQELIDRHRADTIELPDSVNQLDIDTPDDYHKAVHALFGDPRTYGYT